MGCLCSTAKKTPSQAPAPATIDARDPPLQHSPLSARAIPGGESFAGSSPRIARNVLAPRANEAPTGRPAADGVPDDQLQGVVRPVFGEGEQICFFFEDAQAWINTVVDRVDLATGSIRIDVMDRWFTSSEQQDGGKFRRDMPIHEDEREEARHEAVRMQAGLEVDFGEIEIETTASGSEDDRGLDEATSPTVSPQRHLSSSSLADSHRSGGAGASCPEAAARGLEEAAATVTDSSTACKFSFSCHGGHGGASGIGGTAVLESSLSYSADFPECCGLTDVPESEANKLTAPTLLELARRDRRKAAAIRIQAAHRGKLFRESALSLRSPSPDDGCTQASSGSTAPRAVGGLQTLLLASAEGTCVEGERSVVAATSTPPRSAARRARAAVRIQALERGTAARRACLVCSCGKQHRFCGRVTMSGLKGLHAGFNLIQDCTKDGAGFNIEGTTPPPWGRQDAAVGLATTSQDGSLAINTRVEADLVASMADEPGKHDGAGEPTSDEVPSNDDVDNCATQPACDGKDSDVQSCGRSDVLPVC